MTGRLKIMDASGHSTVAWDTDKPKTIEDAEARFKELVNTFRHMAFVPGVHGAPAERIRAFKAEESEIVMVPPMAGGR